MDIAAPTALIADDEPLLRESLERALRTAWPGLRIVARARNGREAVALWEEWRPDIAFLDVHMPGLSGIEAAREMARHTQIVFVTAYEQYALQAFERGAVDYIVKPVEDARLIETVQRLQGRLRERAALAQGGESPAAALRETLAELSRLARQLGMAPPNAGEGDDEDADGALPAAAHDARGYLRWIRASVGATVRMIPVEQVAFLRSDEKYTLVAYDGGEALIRTPIRELIGQLDPQHFAQVHRSVVVNLHAIHHITRGPNETADLHLHHRREVLPVSRSYLHLFRQM